MNISKDGGKKVLIFSTAYLPFIGGAELAVKEVTERISSIQFDMIAARLDRKLPLIEKVGNVNVYRTGLGIPIVDKYWLAFFGHRLAQKLHKKNQYNLIWSIMASYSGFAAMFFKRRNPQMPFLLTLQEGDDPEYIKKRVGFAKPWFRKIFASADYIQCISHFLADWAKQNGATCPIEVVPNGADCHKHQGLPLISRGVLDVGLLKTIITTSRLVHKNGIDVIIKAAAELKKIALDLNFKIQILGSGPDEKKLKDLAKELKVDNIVKFLGHIEPEKVYDYLANADIFVRPSRSEGLGSSFLEAMGAGLPIIGTAIGGIPDFLKDGETGLFCKVDDSQDLAEKIKLLMMDEKLAKRISDNGRQLVLEKYNWDSIAKQIGKILSHIITTCPLTPERSDGGRVANTGDSKKASMKILICAGIYPPDIGGPATYSKLLFDELPKGGLEVKVLSFGEVRCLPKILRHIIYFLKVLRIGIRADVIFAQDPVSVGLPSMLAAKILRKKFILKVVGDYAWEQYQQKSEIRNPKSETNFKFITLEEFQGGKFDFKTETKKKIQKYIAKNAKRIIAPSNYLKNIVLKWGISEEKIKVVYNTFDRPILKETKEELRKKLGLSGTVLISAGRLVPWKGFTTLIEIMQEILREIPDAKLYIIGSGPEMANCKEQIANGNLENKVFLIGQVLHSEALNYLKSGDIFVLNTGYEGFSHFLLEAMAMEIPIITTNVGGNVELIENGKEGLLVKYNDKKELKKKIIELVKNQSLRKKLTEEAKNKIVEFGKERMLEETVKILCES